MPPIVAGNWRAVIFGVIPAFSAGYLIIGLQLARAISKSRIGEEGVAT